MKTITALISVTVALAFFSSTEAAKTRALTIQRCPADSTVEQCEAFAKTRSQKNQYCHTYSIHNNIITWKSCPALSCGDLELVPEDLSKPYPQCCKSCQPSN